MKKIINYFLYFLITIFLLYLYSNFALGYYKDFTLFQNSVVELYIIFVIYTIFYITLSGKKIYYIPIVLVSSYFILDIVSDAYNRYLDFSDLVNIPLLFDALLQSKGDIVYFLFIIPISLLYFFVKFPIFRKYIYSIIIIIILFTIPFLSQSIFSHHFIDFYENNAFYTKKFWSEKKYFNYAQNGRLSTFFYEGMRKEKAKNNIKKYLGNRKKELNIIVNDLKNHIQKRNIYLIGLESFSLPKQLQKLKEKFVFGDENVSYDIVENSSVMITSIFGGGTIQSEFEALCGVPALQQVSAFEFTEFTGSKTNCLPTILSALGYDTIVTNTYKPQPSFEALSSVGFNDINFPKEYFPHKKSYLTNKNIAKGEYAIFDSDLFNQNQKYINTNYLSKNKHVFNYMFSVWGHAMHDMTSKHRKKVIEIKNKNDLGVSEHTINAINQEYYRIRALEKYFNEIKTTDPSALVIAFSDHRPVLDGADKYKEYGLKTDVFHNFIVIMDKGHYIKYNKPFPLYALKDIILDRLTNGWYCKYHECKITSQNKYKYLTEYYNIMANAMNAKAKNEEFYIYPSELYKFDDSRVPFINFSQAESNFRWTNSKKSEIYFNIKHKNDFNGEIELHIATLGKQRISILLNKEKIYQNTLDTRDKIINLKFDKNILNSDKINKLIFILPDARLPGNGDTRILAVQFKSIKFK
jgi:hypothetical protein